MALNQNPSIVTNGLIFYYDMNNKSKSYRGEPTTNQFAIPTPDSNGNVTFEVNGTGTFKRIFSGNFGGYDIKPSDIVYRYDLGSNGCHYHGNDVTITAGLYPTFTFDYYLSPDVSSFGDTFMANFENLGSGISASAVLPNLQKGIWQTIQINGPAASATSGLRMLLYPCGCSGGRLAATGYILMKNPQVTFSSTSGKVLPFVTGTRSNTQTVIDLTGRRTITVTGSPTYSSDGTFTFNSSGSTTLNLGSGNNFLPMPSLTLESWIRTSGVGSGMTVNGIWGFTYGIRFNAYSDGSLGFIVGTNTTTFVSTGTTGVNINDNNWHHVVAVKNEDSYYAIYVDGVVRASGIPVAGWDGTNIWSAMDVQVGRDQNDAPYYFNGRIDIGRVYNRALTASEVLQNFNAQRGRYGL